MQTGRKRTEKRTKQLTTLLVIAMCFLMSVVTVSLFQEFNSKKVEPPTTVDTWHVEWAAKKLPILSETPTTLQLIVTDGTGEWLKQADVKVFLRFADGEKMELSMNYITEGLYETTTQFPYARKWYGNIVVEMDNNMFVQPMEIKVVKK